MKPDIEEYILTVSAEGLGLDAAARMQSRGVGSTLYPNEYGGILFAGNPDRLDFSDKGPAQIQHLVQSAWRHSVTWFKFDTDEYSLSDLTTALGG